MKPLYSPAEVQFLRMKEPIGNCPWCEGKGYEWVECGDLSGYDYREPCRCILNRRPFLPGEKCYLREAWAIHQPGSIQPETLPTFEYETYNRDLDRVSLQKGYDLLYRATAKIDPDFPIHWRSPVTMPQWAARRFVTILSCEPMRVSEVTEEDCLAVGLKKITKDNGRTWKYGIADRDGLPGTDNTGWAWEEWKVDYKEAFKIWWRKRHPGKEWCWRVEGKEETK